MKPTPNLPPDLAAGDTLVTADWLLDMLPWGVVVLDAQGTVRRLNQQAADWWGAPPQDLQGKRPEELAGGAGLPADLLLALQRVPGSSAAPAGEFFLPRHQQWIAMSGARHGDDWVVCWQDITAQRQRQHAHETQQATTDTLLRRTEAAARTGSYELELATERLQFSDGLYRLFGEEPGAFVPELGLIDARSQPDDAAAVRQVLARAVADRQPYYYQRRICHSNGQLRTLECHGRVECDALGEPVKLLGLLQDVTEREQAARELRQAQDALAQRATDSYAALYNSMDEGFCIVEVLFDAARQPVDYRFLDVNPAFEQQTGLRGALGQTMRELVPAIEPFSSQVYGRVARTGEPTRFESHVESMGRWFDVNAFAVGPLENRHVAVLFTDISARKQTEKALRQSEARYRALFTNMEQGFCLLEKVATAPGAPSDYRYLAVNPAFERHTGLRDAVGRTIRELVPGVEPHIVAIYDEALASGEPRRFEEHVAELGLWFEAEAVPDAQPGHLAVLFSNVSVRRQAEQTLRESEARQTYLLALSDALRPVTNAAEVEGTVTRMALRYFGADRCYYAAVAGDTATIGQDAARPGLASLAAVYPLSAMPRYWTAMQESHPLLVADVETSPVVDEDLRQLCRASGVGAFLNVPVRRNGQLVGMLCLNQRTPRAWTVLEADLLQETAERTWTALAQARAEAALRQSEEQFRLLVTATSDTVYRMSADWSRMEQLLGKDFLADTLDPTPDWMDAYIPADELPLVQAAIARAIGARTVFELEHRVRRADGTIGWTYSRAIPVLDARGELSGWLGAASDVSARKQAETGLRESEQRQRVLLENLPGAAVFVVDRELRYQLAEGDALREAGHEPADFVGYTVREMVSPAQWPAFRDMLRQALAGHPFAHEHEQGGRIFLTRGVPRPGPAGRIDAVLAVSYDITERKAAEQALRVSEAKYRTLFETMDQGFGVGEVLPAGPGRAADFRWLEANPQVERLSGVARADMLSGRPMREVMPAVENVWYEQFERVALTGEAVRFEQHSPAMGRWFDVAVSPLDGPAPHRVALLFTNITARKQAEEDLRHAEEHQRERLERQVAERTHQLRENRDLLQSMFDSTTNAVVLLRAVRDAAGGILDFEYVLVNPVAQAHHGRQSPIGRRYRDLLGGTQRQASFERLAAVAKTGRRADFEVFEDYEGRNHWFRLLGVKLGDGVLLTAEDITARKQAEQERTRILSLLKQAEEVAGLGSWDYEVASGQFVWSDGMYRLFGLPPGQAIEPGIYLDYVVDEDRDRAEQFVRQLRAGPQDVEETLRLRVGGAVRTVRLKFVVLRDEQGRPVRTLGVDLDISELHRLGQDNLRLRLSQQQELFEAVQAAQEAERRRMAESLHNGIGQMLYATKLRLDRLHAPALHTAPALAAARDEADHLLSEAIRQTRALSHELVPLVLQDFGLTAALQDLGGKMSTPRLRLRSLVQLDEAAAPLTPALQMALYRMAQELAQNIVKHATGATDASLELETMPGWVLLRAEDNGPGFAPALASASASVPAESAGLGLRSIRDRVALLGGQLEAGTAPAGGAYIRIRIPLSSSSAL